MSNCTWLICDLIVTMDAWELHEHLPFVRRPNPTDSTSGVFRAAQWGLQEQSSSAQPIQKHRWKAHQNLRCYNKFQSITASVRFLKKEYEWNNLLQDASTMMWSPVSGCWSRATNALLFAIILRTCSFIVFTWENFSSKATLCVKSCVSLSIRRHWILRRI